MVLSGRTGKGRHTEREGSGRRGRREVANFMLH